MICIAYKFLITCDPLSSSPVKMSGFIPGFPGSNPGNGVRNILKPSVVL